MSIVSMQTKLVKGFDQNTGEWLDWRSKGIGSSDIPVIMGESPWKTADQLWLEKTGRAESDFKPNFFTEQGKLMEGIARDIYEVENKISMEPATFELVRFPFCRGSFDGFNHELNFGIEIKCPKREEVVMAKFGLIPDKYYPQTQWLMLVSGSKKIDFVVIDQNSTTGELITFTSYRDIQYQKQMLARARRFWYYVKNDIELPKLNSLRGVIKDYEKFRSQIVLTNDRVRPRRPRVLKTKC